jgi:hypothetical protein
MGGWGITTSDLAIEVDCRRDELDMLGNVLRQMILLAS